MRILYISSVIISFLGIGIGIAMINVKSALDAWWKLASIFSGGMLGLFLLAAFSKITKKPGAILGVISGVIVITWISIGARLFGDNTPGTELHAYLAIVLGTITIFIVGFFVSWFAYKILRKNRR
jgi:SSS family solute:Na+ symporter